MPGTMFTASKAFLAPLFMISLSVITSIAAGVSRFNNAIRLAVTLMTWLSGAPFTSVDAAVVGVSAVAVTSAAYACTDNPIKANPISTEVRRFLRVFITNPS